ncbi:Ig-like domain-containing protein [Plantibacter sp. YIM 135249]|uniref:RCC1 domain-containing protein n=1 Tax=Plantibacter sp. YIM 135249 TaxID=3423918 RepID=UPI003D34378E
MPAGTAGSVVAIAAGSIHSLALKADGSVIAWGDNYFRQSTVPAAATTDVTAIAAGALFSLALKADGSVIAWGENYYGQSTVPEAATSGVTAIAAGRAHSLALKADGSVIAWGDNSYKQSLVPAAAMSDVTAIAGGGLFSLALKTDGSVIAWGYNFSGQSTVPAAAMSDVTAIAAGNIHSLALKADGSVIAWGDNGDGQSNIPTAAMSDVTAIAGGERFSLALKADGSVIAWGDNSEGQSTVPADAMSDVTAIAGGGMFSLALKKLPAPVLTADAPPATGAISAAYSYTFEALNTDSFAVASGALPPGLTLTSAGVLAGTPTTAGDFTFTVKATGPGGETVGASHTITVPVAVATTSPTNGSTEETTTPTVSGTGQPGASVVVTDDSGLTVGSATVGADGTWSVVTTTLAAGAHTLSATQITTGGTASSAQISITIEIPATVAITTPADGSTAETTTPTVSGTGQPGASVVLTNNAGSTVGSATVDAYGTWSVVTTTLAAGAHTLSAIQTTTGGTVSSAQISINITIAVPARPTTQTPSLAAAGVDLRGGALAILFVTLGSGLLALSRTRKERRAR